MNDRSIILKAAELRGKGAFKEAIDLLEEHLDEIDEVHQVIAFLELIYASKASGDDERAKTYASRAAEEDPRIPTVQKVLEDVQAND